MKDICISFMTKRREKPDHFSQLSPPGAAVTRDNWNALHFLHVNMLVSMCVLQDFFGCCCYNFFFLIRMTDVVNVRNNSYHIQGINTSLKGSLLSCRVWVGIMVVFQVDQLFKQLGWNMLWSWQPFCTAREPLNHLAAENESSASCSAHSSLSSKR